MTSAPSSPTSARELNDSGEYLLRIQAREGQRNARRWMVVLDGAEEHRSWLAEARAEWWSSWPERRNKSIGDQLRF